MNRICVLVSAILVASSASGAAALERENTPADPQPMAETLGEVEASYMAVSRSVEAAARRIDTFFGGERAYAEATGTYFRIGGASILRDDGTIGFEHRFRLYLDLPHTRKRYRFLIESNPEEDVSEVSTGEDRSAGESRRLASSVADERPNYSAALRFVLAETQRWSLNFDTGIRAEIPVNPFAKARARRTIPLDSWILRLTERVFWFNEEGFGESSRLDFDHSVAPGLLFRSTSEAVWRDRKGEFELSQNLFLFQQLSLRRALAYRLGVVGETDPCVRATEYGASIAYRQKIYKEWLYFQGTPELLFPREEDFRPKPRLTFLLEAIIGERYVEKEKEPAGPWVP
jgi:hypothetical protein